MDVPVQLEAAQTQTRMVLAEIPLREGELSPTDSQNEVGRIDHHVNITYMHSPTNSNFQMLTPNSSPDELIIQQRGRRKVPIVFSPDIDVIKQSAQESSSDLNKSSVILKSTPRKRLLYDLSLEETATETATAQNDLPRPKKSRTDTKYELPNEICVLTAMKALTSNQIISIFEQIISTHPDVEQGIRAHFPVVDLNLLESRIYNLRRNIFKALPSSRLIHKVESRTYSNALVHIMEFKRCVIDEGRRLVESKLWTIVMEYIFMAWKHVHHTPIWENPSYSASRRQCFKSLSEMCMIALKDMKNKQKLDDQKREMYISQLLDMVEDCKESVEMCLKFLDFEPITEPINESEPEKND